MKTFETLRHTLSLWVEMAQIEKNRRAKAIITCVLDLDG